MNFSSGFCVLEKNTEVFYKTSKYYNFNHEETILWNDKSLSINWKVNANKVILSSKDKLAKKFIEIKSPFN